MARVLKLTLQYDGGDYVGWQRQPSGTSIQGLIEDALQPIEGAPVTVHGAGRTDAGVHALGQVCSFRLNATIDPETLARALNAVLPPDVRVASSEEAPPDFHARFDATGKVYDYRIVNGPFISPFVRRYAWHVIPPLDVSAMQDAAQALIGEHDFTTFRGAGSEAHTSVRTITRITWSGSGGPADPLTIRFEGNGFLRHMVRSIAGTLVETGLGRWPASAMTEVLESRDRTRAGRTAPPQGLFLRSVGY